MTQQLEYKSTNDIGKKDYPEKTARKRLRPKEMKRYIFLLLSAAAVTVIFLVILIVVNQKYFIKAEGTAILIYHPMKYSDKIPSLSNSEVLQIIRSAEVKTNTWKEMEFSQDKKKTERMKEALDLTCDFTSDYNNTLKLNVRWNNLEEAKQLTEGYIHAAIDAYVRNRNNHLNEIRNIQERIKSQMEKEKASIEEQLSKLGESYSGQSLKQELVSLTYDKNIQEGELADLRKQLSKAKSHIDSLNILFPNLENTQKTKIIAATHFTYVMELIKKRDEALENYTVLNELGAETDPQVREAQLRFDFTKDKLESVLATLKVKEEDFLDLTPASIKLLEDMEFTKINISVLENHINAIQKSLSEIQTKILSLNKNLPQEEIIQEKHKDVIAQINEINRTIMKIDLHMPKDELHSFSSINVHCANAFSQYNIPPILVGLAIAAVLAPYFILATMIEKNNRPQEIPKKTSAK